ncbi:MAG: response regulator [Deltaproteobacteria bacterium]|nr:MAG: response regulator [Deltaproteobacteria bacterium]
MAVEVKPMEMENTLLYSQLLHIQKMEAMGKLTSGVIHEINNYLATIMGNCEIIKMKEELPREVSSRLDTIIDTSHKASRLLRDLLAFTRSGEGGVEVVSPNDVVLRMKKMLEGVIGENITLSLLLGEGVSPVRVDPSKLEQAIINLVINARDAMPTGGKITIETKNITFSPEYIKKHHIMEVGEYVMIAVTDTGIGIPEEIRDKVFKPFFTTKDVGKGSGLGLSTVYGIVKEHRGYVFLYSEVGQGTTFKIYLPAVVKKETGRDKEGKAFSHEDFCGDERILLVEDNEGIRETTKEILESAGYSVVPAASAEEALEIFERDSGFHLLLTDVILPGKNGRELMEELRARKKDLKVVFMSGYTDGVLFVNGVLYKGINFLQKPFTSLDVLKIVRQVLDEK